MVMNDPLLSVEYLSKSFPSGLATIEILKTINLTLFGSSTTSIQGVSGCGKTTLISVIAGILDQDEGECILFGQDLRKFSKNERVIYRGKNIGFVFQSFNLIPTLTAAENVAIPLLINGMNMEEALSHANERLRDVELEERRNSLPTQLSGGQQQRVAIARALVHGPKLVVCDEPTSALDHETGRRVMDILKKLAVGHGRSLVIVTHDARIFDFADRIAHMDDGRIGHVDANIHLREKTNEPQE